MNCYMFAFFAVFNTFIYILYFQINLNVTAVDCRLHASFNQRVRSYCTTNVYRRYAWPAFLVMTTRYAQKRVRFTFECCLFRKIHFQIKTLRSVIIFLGIFKCCKIHFFKKT